MRDAVTAAEETQLSSDVVKCCQGFPLEYIKTTILCYSNKLQVSKYGKKMFSKFIETAVGMQT